MSFFRKGKHLPEVTAGGNRKGEAPSRRPRDNESGDCGGAGTAAARTPARTPEPTGGGPRLLYGWSSERGARKRNEDFCSASDDGCFFAVSDGIGGGPHGDVMSRIAVARAVEGYVESGDPVRAFAEADGLASQVSRLLGEGDGATLLLAAYDRCAARLDILSAGDTLAYRLRDGELSLLSGGEGRVRANALEKAVGWGGAEPDRVSTDVRAGDRFLLATDGVWVPLGEEGLAEMLRKGTAAPWAAAHLCEEATKRGTDNATAICIFAEDNQDADSRLHRQHDDQGDHDEQAS